MALLPFKASLPARGLGISLSSGMLGAGCAGKGALGIAVLVGAWSFHGRACVLFASSFAAGREQVSGCVLLLPSLLRLLLLLLPLQVALSPLTDAGHAPDCLDARLGLF